MNRSEFRARVANGLLLDGATGSNLMAAGKPRGIPSEDWVLENPHALHALQRAYVEAGSDIVYAPTFTATRAYRDDDIVALNRRLVEVCREGVGDSCLIGGDVTTVTRPDYEYGEMLDIYREQMEALCEAGVDAIAIETMMALPETMAALEAARSCGDIAVLCSFSVSADGGLYFGGNVFEAAQALEELGADAVGVNCSAGPDQLESVIRNLRATVSIPIIAKPNAGMPVIDDLGNAIYPMRPADFGVRMKRLLDAGATIVGGCCGTTPAHIASLREVLRP